MGVRTAAQELREGSDMDYIAAVDNIVQFSQERYSYIVDSN